MPHIPARIIPDRATLGEWVARYTARPAWTQALLLGGGVTEPRGRLPLVDATPRDRALRRRSRGSTSPGHPEGNRDIDPDGSDRSVMEALRWKQAFADRTDAEMAIATQFAFEAEPVVAWAERLRAEGIALPIHHRRRGAGEAPDHASSSRWPAASAPRSACSRSGRWT